MTLHLEALKLLVSHSQFCHISVLVRKWSTNDTETKRTFITIILSQKSTTTRERRRKICSSKKKKKKKKYSTAKQVTILFFAIQWESQTNDILIHRKYKELWENFGVSHLFFLSQFITLLHYYRKLTNHEINASYY